ncbi:hypothetical protein F2Q69_00018890 [Brassica cretica]|uniref:Uncharacterized protein n=1 Tax=Brassica cretica TaxID=69181 RepID=A0A8S9QH82_BRACR|nr:hypothetical protein F2Q69_00018890 [Brassica cretica]
MEGLGSVPCRAVSRIPSPVVSSAFSSLCYDGLIATHMLAHAYRCISKGACVVAWVDVMVYGWLCALASPGSSMVQLEKEDEILHFAQRSCIIGVKTWHRICSTCLMTDLVAMLLLLYEGGEILGSSNAKRTNNLIIESERTHNGGVGVGDLQSCEPDSE